MHSQEDELLLVTEVAALYGVSVRTVERWVELGLPAQKATEEQLLGLLAQKRVKGWPPKGVWVIPRESLSRVEEIRKPVGYPRGKSRKRVTPSTEP